MDIKHWLEYLLQKYVIFKRNENKSNIIELLITLWPSFSHFSRFAQDERLAGIRLNPAMITLEELNQEFIRLENSKVSVPLYFDVKGRQLRITEIIHNPDRLEIRLNHPIKVATPTVVLFKAAADSGLLVGVEEDGYRLVFGNGRYSPRYQVKPGESIHIRHSSLQIFGPTFVPYELQKIEQAVRAGFKQYFLSYVESNRDVDEFLELVGRDSSVMLKIENKKGLDFVAHKFRKRPNIKLVAARGDLYVEIDQPHDIMSALKLIIEHDPQACVGSRILLSVIHESVPSCADFLEMSWLYDIGYRSFMLCDELCLVEEHLATATNVFQAFREAYT